MLYDKNKIGRLIKSAVTVIHIKMGRRIPLKVTHCITWKCNLSCVYCARHCNESELNTKSVFQMIDIFSAGGTLYWSFNGGEPLTGVSKKHPDPALFSS